MNLNSLSAISPIDGRYSESLVSLRAVFSEWALMRFRLLVEIGWLLALSEHEAIEEVPTFSESAKKTLAQLIENFSDSGAESIKNTEKTIRHDVKSVEYFLKEQLQSHNELKQVSEFVHFACTSEDINNLSYALMLKAAVKDHFLPMMDQLIHQLKSMAHQYAEVAMLSRTHGQPATPTTVGKEIAVFVARLKQHRRQLAAVKILGKCNGAIGNYNAHMIAYPDVDWQMFTRKFVEHLGLHWNMYTTQIEPHDYIAELSHAIMRWNTTLIDFCRDMWTYIAKDYFQQKVKSEEVGSSTMPHKVNPIDFENAEGNLGLSNALFQFFAAKLPISRMQRDLSDSTVLRNIGVAFSHAMLAGQSIQKGLDKLIINEARIRKILLPHWEVVSEALQTVMRRYGVEAPYEKLKDLTRGEVVDQYVLQDFIETLPLPENVKKQLKQLTPENYLGAAVELARDV